MTCGKKLLIDWVKEETVTILNDNKGTRVDPGSNKESLLDLAFVSNNIKNCVKSFKVDTSKSMTVESTTATHNRVKNFLSGFISKSRPLIGGNGL